MRFDPSAAAWGPVCPVTPTFAHSGDIDSYAPGQLSSVDVLLTGLAGMSRRLSLQHAVQLPEPVAAGVDVDDLDVVQQAV
jgi:hypothetical protein